MRTLNHPLVGIALLARVLGAALPAGAATIEPCGSARYGIDGAPLDLGAGATAVTGFAFANASFGGAPPELSVRLSGSCGSASATQVARDDKFIARARFTGCGDLTSFRLRLAFAPDCRTVVGRIKSAGQVIAQFTATNLRRDEPNPPDGDEPTFPPPPAPESPELSVFAPLAAGPADTISIFGENLDRGRDGERWLGTTDTPPYLVRFRRAGSIASTVNAEFVFLAENELRVTVPRQAGSGEILLLERRADGSAGQLLSETAERFIVTSEVTTPVPPPVTGSVPPSANRGQLVVQGTELNALLPGTFQVSGTRNQVGAFLDEEGNHIVDLAGGRNDVPYLAFPVRTSEFDFTVEQGRGYFVGANAMVWMFFEDGDGQLDNGDVFVTVHLDVDFAAGTARPVAMLAGAAGSPGIVVSTNEFSEFQLSVDAPVVGGPGAIRGHVAAVPTFLELIFLPSQPSTPGSPDFPPSIEQRLWANGLVLDFDVPLFND